LTGWGRMATDGSVRDPLLHAVLRRPRGGTRRSPPAPQQVLHERRQQLHESATGPVCKAEFQGFSLWCPICLYMSNIDRRSVTQ
jgi:hypothetical protein